jgi:hypothetical protein
LLRSDPPSPSMDKTNASDRMTSPSAIMVSSGYRSRAAFS